MIAIFNAVPLINLLLMNDLVKRNYLYVMISLTAMAYATVFTRLNVAGIK